jgi:hypothetical protein
LAILGIRFLMYDMNRCLRIMGGKDIFAVRQIWDDETEKTEVKDEDETMSDAFEN